MILRVTNYVKHRQGGLQGDYTEFMIFFLVTLYLWVIFRKFPEIKGLGYMDDDNTSLSYRNHIRSKIHKIPHLIFSIRLLLQTFILCVFRSLLIRGTHDSRPVLTPSQRILSLQIMKFWDLNHRSSSDKITTVVDNEPGDIEIKDYVVLPRGQDNFLCPHPLILDFTMTHVT